jgi:hypothetical protein
MSDPTTADLQKQLRTVEQAIEDMSARIDKLTPAEDTKAKLSGADLTKTQFDYAWKWFDHHAKQRISMFNYFIVIVGIIASAIGVLYKDAKSCPECFENGSFMLSIAGMAMAVIFIFLDLRNRQLVGYAKETLTGLEERELFAGDLKQAILSADKNRKGCARLVLKHSLLIPLVMVICLAGFVGLFLGYKAISKGLATKTTELGAPAPSDAVGLKLNGPPSAGRASLAEGK